MMSKLIVLVCLLAVSWAQSSTVDPDVIEPSSTVAMPDAVSSTAMEPTASPYIDENSTLAERYNASQASTERRRHFYCLTEMMTSFPAETVKADGGTDYIYWSILLQYPVLSYLDLTRKEKLLYVILSLAKSGDEGTNRIQSLSESNLCIGAVDQYRVSYYEESVLIRIYFNGDIVVTPDSPTTGVSIADFNQYFLLGFNEAARNPSDYRVQTFMGRNAIAINLTMSMGDFINENVHPGGKDLSPNEDPTLRAVVIGTYIGNLTIGNATANRTQQFANNPRPINYSLEAGDIIFAVFGSLFLAVLGGLIILGFCIHPFFLA